MKDRNPHLMPDVNMAASSSVEKAFLRGITDHAMPFPIQTEFLEVLDAGHINDIAQLLDLSDRIRRMRGRCPLQAVFRTALWHISNRSLAQPKRKLDNGGQRQPL
jgi:hypothetical protein